jgi:hypothetical protein
MQSIDVMLVPGEGLILGTGPKLGKWCAGTPMLTNC